MTIYEYNARLDKERLPILAEGKKYNIDGRKNITTPEDIAHIAGDVIGLRDAAEEYAWCIAMNTKNKIIGLFEVGHGTINSCLFDVRGVMQKALMLGAAAIAITHNHPSEDPTPSREDIAVTNRVNQAAEIIGITFVDHVIVAGNSHCSLRDYGYIK